MDRPQAVGAPEGVISDAEDGNESHAEHYPLEPAYHYPPYPPPVYPPYPPPLYPMMEPPPPHFSPIAMAQWYEASAAAYAQAAAGAAHMAAHMAQVATESRPPSFRRRLRSDGDSSKSDDSLVGKTAVAALHEWCSKRQHERPKFVQTASNPFQFEVWIHQKCQGTGKAYSKGAARQLAARKALQAVAPGIVLDAGGMVIALPDIAADLGPHLARRLALDREKRTLSSEDEDSYHSLQASVLLHGLVRVDDRIPQGPTFEVSPQGSSLRGPFQCVARLRIRAEELETKEEEAPRKPTAADKKEVDDDESETSSVKEPSPAKKIRRDSSVERPQSDAAVPKEEVTEAPKPTTMKTLEAVGLGTTKREARHVAAAKLLALLFPECETMEEVRQAAEDVRTRYSTARETRREPDVDVSFLMPHDDEPDIPADLRAMLRATLGEPLGKNRRVYKPRRLDEDRKPPAVVHTNSLDRHTSRQLQRSKWIEESLETFNERDEEGRVLPGELTEDDVGRTVLRRALPDDFARVHKLFSQDQSHSTTPVEDLASGFLDPDAHFGAGLENAFVLLLCRAIAAYEDPPLGCAVLSLGYTEQHGRVLRIVKSATESHLPPERFLECLEDFAKVMKCKALLPDKRRSPRRKVYDVQCLSRALEPYTIEATKPPLQSVQEESGESDSSNAEPSSKNRSRNPSKRSRVM